MRLAAPVCVALGLVLTGCFSTPQPATPAGPEVPSPGPTTDLPATLIGGGAIEASLDVGADGSMLACAMGAGAKNPVWGSEDGGATWRELQPLPAQFANGDCDVAVGGDGTWYVITATSARLATLPPNPTPLKGVGSSVGLLLATSHDHGATWDVQPVKPFPGGCVLPVIWGCVGHRPWLREVEGKLFLTWYTVPTPASAVPTASAVFQRSDDGGRTWTVPQVLAQARAFVGGGKFDVADQGRTLRMGLTSYAAGNVTYGMAVSKDAGATWTTQPVLGPVPGRTGIVTLVHDAEGRLYFPVTLGTPDQGYNVTVLVSRDDGAHWDATMVAEGLRVGNNSLAMAFAHPTPSGVMLAWLHPTSEDNVAGWVLSAAGFDADATPPVQWTRDLAPPADAEGHFEFFSMAHDAQGRVHLAFPIPEPACDDPAYPVAGIAACIYHLVLS